MSKYGNQEIFLKRYLNSLGNELPDDWLEHQRGREMQHKCVFCKNTHENYVVFQFNPLKDSMRQLEGTVFMCSSCEIFVNTMVEMHYSHLKVSADDYNDSMNRRYGVPSQEPDSAVKNKQQMFNLTRRFEYSVMRHYIHLNKNYDLYASDTCYFCNKDAPNYKRIRVPVMSDSEYLTGGYVKVCSDCGYHIEDIYEGRTDKVQKCSKCSDTYLISEEEHFARAHIESLGKHCCPACVYEHELSLPTDDVLFHEDSQTRRIIPIKRFRFKSCTICEHEVQIDITVLPKIRKKQFKDGKFYCPHCLAAGLYLSSEERVRVSFNDRVSILLMKNNNNWSYVIYQVQSGKRFDIARSHDAISEDAVECTFIAYEECSKLLDAKQLEIWPKVEVEDP